MQSTRLIVAGLFIAGCGSPESEVISTEKVDDAPAITQELAVEPVSETSIVILGTCQDGGSPHAGCEKACCKGLFENPDPRRMVVSLGLIDTKNHENYLFEASPDLPRQMKFLCDFSASDFNDPPSGIFLTHAHIGHYTGLMFLGKEANNCNEVPVYVMPKMKSFLEENGPWSQLVDDQNIALKPLQNEEAQELNADCSVTPFLVPHRDEYSETVGFRITGPNKSAIFIPDIDKWENWDQDILAVIQTVDYAFLDGTFFNGEELKTRDISSIPHPFISESMELFSGLDAADKAKIIFIHFNHTNELLIENSANYRMIENAGFRVARFGDVFPL